jgi:cystathionine beta-synthase
MLSEKAPGPSVGPAHRSYPTVLELIGNTPLVQLQRIAPEDGPLLLAKLEYMNPGGSVKDRIGLRMIEKAEREGLLKPGGTTSRPAPRSGSRRAARSTRSSSRWAPEARSAARRAT